MMSTHSNKIIKKYADELEQLGMDYKKAYNILEQVHLLGCIDTAETEFLTSDKI